MGDIRATRNLAYGQLTNARQSILTECIKKALSVITPLKIQRYYVHSQAFYGACLAKEDLGDV
jgi:hypothetical protein